MYFVLITCHCSTYSTCKNSFYPLGTSEMQVLTYPFYRRGNRSISFPAFSFIPSFCIVKHLSSCLSDRSLHLPFLQKEAWRGVAAKVGEASLPIQTPGGLYAGTQRLEKCLLYGLINEQHIHLMKTKQTNQLNKQKTNNPGQLPLLL